MRHSRMAACVAIVLGVVALAPRASASMAAGECQCNLSVISGATGMTMTGDAVRGPCGKAMSAGKVVAAQSRALATAGSPSANVISSPFEDAAVASIKDVTVNSNFYTAQTVNITAGDTVKWTVASGFHTVTSDTGLFDSGGLGSPSTFSFTFNTPGTYGYHCTFHGGNGTGMFGTVNVAAAPEPFAAAVFVPVSLLALRRRRSKLS